jgi:penicillin-binding protein 1A
VKPNYFRLFIQLLMGVTAVTFAVAYAFVCSYVYLEPTLPTVAAMKNSELSVPLRVYTRSGDLIAQIGEQRRNPVKFEQIPDNVKNAFIAAEDDRFFQHHGFDWQGCVRMLFVNVTRRAQGASTITMQAARSAFFTQEQTVRRKLQEIFVTYRLEREFTKEEILALYLNVIFFGSARTAWPQPRRPTSASSSTISRSAKPRRSHACRSGRRSTIRSPIRRGATDRRKYVLRRMRELGFIDEGRRAERPRRK